MFIFKIYTHRFHSGWQSVDRTGLFSALLFGTSPSTGASRFFYSFQRHNSFPEQPDG